MRCPQPRLKRSPVILIPDSSRVLIRPFLPSADDRIRKILDRILALSDAQVEETLGEVMEEFADRHFAIEGIFERHYRSISSRFQPIEGLSEARRLLIGAYFTSEYALESAALFNPSIVPHPDQSNLPEGALRFVLSLRAVGEGHISSICFRSGFVDARHQITIDPPTRYVTEPKQVSDASYDKPLFERKLAELGLANSFARRVMNGLPNPFTMANLRERVHAALLELKDREAENFTTAHGILRLARSNYEAHFSPEQQLSERSLFPMSPTQSNGIEDARFVLFTDDDGTQTYYATYTAFDGRLILPQMLETEDFLHFQFHTLNGPAAQNKGMALFPRKINGLYAMISRQDNENIFLMFSDNRHFWYEPRILLQPREPWELVQMGNCGSPIETHAGWLVLSHGVGPMRKYCIGAFLLDRDDPGKVIGRMRQPLIKPNENEREGYVPNVVYTCGALLHGDELIIPYAMSDFTTGFVTVALQEVLDAMT